MALDSDTHGWTPVKIVDHDGIPFVQSYISRKQMRLGLFIVPRMREKSCMRHIPTTHQWI